MTFVYQDLDTPYAAEDEIPNPAGRRTVQRTVLLQLDFGLSERLAARAVLPLRSISTSGMFRFRDEGAGDAELWARFRLGPEIGKSGGAVSGGLALPTGKDVQASLTEENNVAFGAGAVSALVSVEGFRRLSSRQNLFGLLTHRHPLDEGDGNYRFGPVTGWAGNWSFTLPEAGGVGFNLGLLGQHLGRDEQSGMKVGNRGGRLHYVSAGLHLPVGTGTVGLSVQRLVDADMRGDQLLSTWNFLAGYSFTWGEHEHAGEVHHDDEDHH